mmetsp:Transcript_38651/g.152633  ORF Transcript_38651/g.152633 Transcript_38651/m.152633 type:complete len:485 (+) Transcript_38651:462-1916(+)
MQGIYSIEFLTEQAKAWVSMNQYQHLLELMCVLLSIYFWLQRAYKPKSKGKKKLTREEIELACKQWKSVPLGEPPHSAAEVAWKRNSLAAEYDYVMKSESRETVDVADVKGALNLASFNFSGLQGSDQVKEACAETMKHYGCGSCGPRGFYGTTDVHLRCEERVAEFCGSKDAIVYSFGTATMSSVIPAFCKRDDVLICDEGVSYAVQAGCHLSRSQIHWFKHNDVEDLKRILEDIRQADVADPKRPSRQRRFIVLEALYTDYGDFSPLKEIIKLKKQYKYRLIVDESNSIGVLGASGHGVCEELDIPRDEIEVSGGDFSPALGTIGGFIVGERIVVNHQRLSGAGYCFSAAQPPYLATAAIEAMNLLDSEGESRVAKLRQLTRKFRDLLSGGCGKYVEVLGDRDSPIIHLKLLGTEDEVELQKATLRKQKQLLDEGVFVSAPLYVGMIHKIPEPTLRLSVSAAHDEKMLTDAAVKICTVLTRD